MGANLPIDPKHLSPHAPWDHPGVPRTVRGRIEAGALGKWPHTILHFMWNPTRLTLHYTSNPDWDVSAPQSADAQGPQGGGSINFDLLFDRTYEVATGKDPRGCLTDLLIAEELGGIEPGGPSMVLVQRQLIVLFGGPNTIKFEGFMTSMAPVIEHFSPAMVPMRMTLNVTVERRSAHQAPGAVNPDTTAAPRSPHVGAPGSPQPYTGDIKDYINQR